MSEFKTTEAALVDAINLLNELASLVERISGHLVFEEDHARDIAARTGQLSQSFYND